MKKIVEKLNTLEYRVRQIGNNKTNSTRRSQESYRKDLIEVPELIKELESDLKESQVNENNNIFKRRLDLAKNSFKYWS